MKWIKKFENSQKIVLRNSIGEIVFDYLKIIESGDLEMAKNYLLEWTDGDIRIVWDGESYVPATITTLKRFMTPNIISHQKSKGYDVIEITKELLDEIKNTNK